MPTDPPENSFHAHSQEAWREWLSQNHERKEGIWFITNKKHTGKPRVDLPEAIDEAICFGWIDSKTRSLDAERSMFWFTPRKPKTGWSRLNKQRVERLLAAGRIAPPGLAKIDAAKADGSWYALDGVEATEIPADLAAAFSQFEHAKANFDAFPRFTKRTILEWISNAKRPETRARRVEVTARLAEQNIRANQ